LRTNVVSSSALARWDAGFHLYRPAPWKGQSLVEFGDVATRRIDPIGASDFDGIQLGSIHFDGSISLRKSAAGRGKLFRALPGDLVFSKIDARNGAIGVITGTTPLAFSSEFPIYSFESLGKVRPAYAQLLCRTDAFKARLNSLVVGHSGRKRLAPDLLEQLEIPVPDLNEQGELVAEYQQNVELATQCERRADELAASAYEDFLEELGIEYRSAEAVTGVFVARLAQISSWSARRVRHVVDGGGEAPASSFPVLPLGSPEIGSIAYGLTKSPDNRPDANPRPYLRVANVQAGTLDLTAIKYIDLPADLLPRYELRDGDLLLCEGNSEALVGRPAVWRDEIPGCIHQNHVLRVRLDQANLDPDFTSIYMNSAPARAYFLARAKRTTNLASINSTDVAEFPCPVPPIDLQARLVREHGQQLQMSRSLREEAADKRNNALKRAEAELVEPGH